MLARQVLGELRRLLAFSSSDRAASEDGVLLQMEWLEDFVLNELVLSGETYVLQSGEPGRTRL